MKKRMKRFLAVVLSAAMLLSYTGVSFAEELISELIPAEAAENIEMAEASEVEEAAGTTTEETGAEPAGPAEQQEENLTEKLLQKKGELPKGSVNLVSFGDSMTNGYGHDGYYEENTQVNGFRQNDVKTTYPYYLMKYLEGQGATVNWEALAISCMRTEDVNFLLRYHTSDDIWNRLAAELDDTVASVENWNNAQKNRWELTFVDDGNVIGDYFTWNEFVNGRFKDWKKAGNSDTDVFPWASNPTLAYAKYFQDKAKDADVITLGTGNANFGVIMLQNITSLLTGAFGSGFKDAVPVREVLQRRLPAEIVPAALDILDKVDEMVVPQLGMLGDNANKVLEIVEYTTVSFMFSYMDMLYAIDELNDKDNLDVIMMGLMNTMDGVKIDLGDGQILDLGAVVDVVTDVLSAYYFVLPTALQELKGDFENITFYMVPNEDHIEMQVAEMQRLEDIKAKNIVRERMIQEVSGMIFDLVRSPLNSALSSTGVQLPDWGDADDRGNKYISDEKAGEYREKVEAYELLQADYQAWVEGGYTGDFGSEAISILQNPNDALACAVYLAFERAIIKNAGNATLDINGLMSLMGGTEGLAAMMAPIVNALTGAFGQEAQEELTARVIKSAFAPLSTETDNKGNNKIKPNTAAIKANIQKIIGQLSNEQYSDLRGYYQNIVDSPIVPDYDLTSWYNPNKIPSNSTAVENAISQFARFATDSAPYVTEEMKSKLEELKNSFTIIELTKALNGALGEALVSEEAASLGGLLSLYARMIIGNGIGSHPTENGHKTLFNEILKVYPNVTAQDKILNDAQDAFRELQKILAELGAETEGFVEEYTEESVEYGKLLESIEELKGLLEADKKELYNALSAKADDAGNLAWQRFTELKNDLDTQEAFLKEKGDEYWGKALKLKDDADAAMGEIQTAYNEVETALSELYAAEVDTCQTIIEKLPDAQKIVNVTVIPDMQDAVKAFAAMKNSSVRLAGKVKAAKAAIENFENVINEKTAAICEEVMTLHDELAELHDEGVEAFNQKMKQYAGELKEDSEAIREMIGDVYALLMDQTAGIKTKCEEIIKIAKGLPEDIKERAWEYAEEHGLIEKYQVPVTAAYLVVTEISKLLEEYPDMPQKAWELAEQSGLLDKLYAALNDLLDKYSEAVCEELTAMIKELKRELSGLEDCEFSKEEFEKKAEAVCDLLKEKCDYLQNELEKIKRLENCLRIASECLLGEASKAAKELGNKIWQMIDTFENGFEAAKQRMINLLEERLAELRTELSRFQTELAGKICEEIRRTEAMIREMAEKGKAGVIEMSGMICDMMKKICSEIREVVYDATHTDYYMHKGNNYVALGGKTLNAYYLNCDDIPSQRYSRLVADALTEEYKKPVKDDVKTDLDLTVINGEAFVKKNAEKLAEADLITYQVDADVKTLVKILMGESKGDISDYVPADTLEIARRLEDVLEEILVSDWSEETQKKADEAKKKLVEKVNANVSAIYDGSDPELIVNEEYLASVDRHIERVMDAMIAKMVETAGVLNAQKEAALAGVIENRALIRDYFEKAAYIAIAYAVETVKVSETMRAINPEAAILLVGMYNPLQGVTVKLGEDTINVGNLFDYIIMASNMYCTAYAAVSETVTYVAVPGTKIGMEPQTINVNDPAEIVKAIFGIVTDDKATYATVAGHENIKERIIDALNVIPYTLTGIAVTAAPAKTSYVEGQSFDPTGMEITAAYSDGTSEVVSGWTVTDGEALTAGKQSVTISYTEDGVEATTTQAVTVVTKVPTALTVKTAPAKTAYVAGQAFDPTGMVVVATYNDGTSAETKSYVVIGGDALTEGQTSVTISYTSGETVTTTQAVTVVAKVPTALTVKTAPAKTAYVAGQAFDPTGMVVEAAYNDGTTAEITGYEVINGKALTAGQTSVTISYTVGSAIVTTTQEITVKAKVPTGITVKKAPNKTSYVAGENFDPAGMVIQAIFNDGTTAQITGYEVIDGNALTAGQTSVTISYTVNGVTVTTTQQITVVAKVPTAITVKTAPAKTSYVAGEKFDPAGMVIEAAFNDGTTAQITGYTVTDGDALKAGQTSVTISYTVDGVTVTTTQQITVKAKYAPIYYGGGSVNYVLFTGTWNNPVTNGTWIQDANGVWHYRTSQEFRNTWAYIYNPYAGEGQNKNDWFWFDANGNMLTGWQFINGKWYYLNPTMNGTLGACLIGPGKTPDGWEIDASGAWTGR